MEEKWTIAPDRQRASEDRSAIAEGNLAGQGKAGEASGEMPEPTDIRER